MNTTTLKDQLQQNYDGYYSGAEAEWRRLGAIDKAANIVTLCERCPRRSVLEIGAGDGSILKRLAELEFAEQLYALEISSSGLEAIAAKRIPTLVEAKLFDGYHVPYNDGVFDIAVLSHVIEHVEFPRQLLYEASRVAKFVFIEVPLEDMSRLPADYTFSRVGHINQYSPRTIRWLVQSSGLRVITQTVSNPSKATYLYSGGRKSLLNFYVKQFLLDLFPGIATKHFAYHCSLLCEKAPA